MKNIPWGAKIAWEPRDRLTSKLPGNHLLITWKPPATSLEGFWMKNITWGAKIAWEPRDRLTSEMNKNHLETTCNLSGGFLDEEYHLWSQNGLGTQR